MQNDTAVAATFYQRFDPLVFQRLTISLTNARTTLSIITDAQRGEKVRCVESGAVRIVDVGSAILLRIRATAGVPLLPSRLLAPARNSTGEIEAIAVLSPGKLPIHPAE